MVIAVGLWFSVLSSVGWAFGLIVAIPIVLGKWDALVGWRLSAVVTALVVGFRSWDGSGIMLAAATVLVAYTTYVSIRFERGIALWAWAACTAIVAASSYPDTAAAVFGGGVMALLTDALRSRRMGAEALETEQRRFGLERAKRIGVEERSRVARELHDVVAHHMSMVAVRAETAPYRIKDLPEAIAAEFVEISSTARESLNEIRGLLSVLRNDDAPRMPQPGLGELEDLIEASRRAGAEVELTVWGDARPLRPAVELAAYRILQESLSNVTRHAPGEAAEVWVEYGENELGLVVSNPSRASVREPGHGITGMRERAAAVGGSLDARRRPHGRFVVEALLPVEQ